MNTEKVGCLEPKMNGLFSMKQVHELWKYCGCDSYTVLFKSLRFVKLSEGNKWPWTPRNEIGGLFWSRTCQIFWGCLISRIIFQAMSLNSSKIFAFSLYIDFLVETFFLPIWWVVSSSSCLYSSVLFRFIQQLNTQYLGWRCLDRLLQQTVYYDANCEQRQNRYGHNNDYYNLH